MKGAILKAQSENYPCPNYQVNLSAFHRNWIIIKDKPSIGDGKELKINL